MNPTGLASDTLQVEMYHCISTTASMRMQVHPSLFHSTFHTLDTDPERRAKHNIGRTSPIRRKTTYRMKRSIFTLHMPISFRHKRSNGRRSHRSWSCASNSSTIAS
eukprot:4273833-Pleurochrysis_carterae.AAC.1